MVYKTVVNGRERAQQQETCFYTSSFFLCFFLWKEQLIKEAFTPVFTSKCYWLLLTHTHTHVTVRRDSVLQLQSYCVPPDSSQTAAFVSADSGLEVLQRLSIQPLIPWGSKVKKQKQTGQSPASCECWWWWCVFCIIEWVRLYPLLFLALCLDDECKMMKVFLPPEQVWFNHYWLDRNYFNHGFLFTVF